MLAGSLDIIEGVYVQEACVAELWTAYKRQLYLRNYGRREDDIQDGLSLTNFRRYIILAVGLKLIKHIRTNPPEYEYYTASLNYMTEDDLFQNTFAMRKVYKLTLKGMNSKDWNRLSTAYVKKFPGKSKKENR